MERSTLDLWVGIFVCAGIGALLILALKVGNISSIGGGDTYRIYGEFQNIGGLKPKAPVKSSGVVVGRVTEITFDNEKFQAKVAMDIDKRYQFPRDTSAAILTSGLLGEQYIGLSGGGDTVVFKNGDAIQPALAQSAVVLEDLISKFLYNKAAEGNSGK